ncbi:MAG: cyclic nucleotide-binding domain-containing protein [Myxococcaceae bacterium]
MITAAPALQLPTAVVAPAADAGSGGPPGMKPRRAAEVAFTTEPAQPGDQVEVLLTPSARKNEALNVAAATARPADPLAPAAPPSRIWLPPGFGGAPAAPSAPEPAAAPAAEAPGPAGAKKFRSDREAGLAALSKFSELDIDLDAPPPPEVAPPAPPPAIAPAAPEPRRSRPAGLPSFTELELEGDSLLHAVETAAQAGIAQRAQPGDAPEPETDGVFDDPGDMKQIPLFSDLPPDAFIELFERCPLRRLSEGERIIEQGSLGDAFYVICEGSVRVYREEDGEKKPIATLTDGAFFGEMALLSGAPRTASVESASDETQLLEISAPVLAQLSHRYPQVARALKKFCRQRLLSNVMNSSPLFQPFSRDDRRSLVQRFRARDVNKGEALVKEGERSDGMYIVLSGEVEVVKDGTRLALLKEGDLFGEMSLLSKSPATATVAASKHTSLLRLPREDFDELILSHPQILVLVSELTDDRRRQTEAVLGGAATVGEEGLLLV